MNAIEFLAIPPNQWHETLNAMDEKSRESLEKELSWHAATAMLATSYVASQVVFGHDHDKSVKIANRDLERSRKIIGDAYPKSGRIAF